LSRLIEAWLGLIVALVHEQTTRYIPPPIDRAPPPQDLDLFSVSRTWKDLVDRAKSKKLTPAEYSSGTVHDDKVWYYIRLI